MDSDAAKIPKGTLIDISGLQSAVGKKCNGASGIITGLPSVEESSVRYPVLLYALPQQGTMKPLKEPFSRSIKAENLKVKTDQACLHFLGAAVQGLQLRFQGGSSKEKEQVLFLLQSAKEKFPEDRGLKITYANALRYSEPKKALELLKEIVPKLPEDYKTYDTACYDLAIAYVLADDDLEEAFVWAQKYPLTSDKTTHMELYEQIRRAVTQKTQNAKQDPEHKFANLLVRVVQAMIERDPQNPDNLPNLAAAQCLSGDNLEGSKTYRRAIQLLTGALSEYDLLRLKRDCCLAQMQCPGMPMHNMVLLGTDGGTHWICSTKEAMPDYEYTRSQGVAAVLPTAEGLYVQRFPVLYDPNDQTVFGSLLPQLQEP